MGRNEIQKRLGALVAAHGKGACWVCGSVRGVKKSRNSYAVRCRRCVGRNMSTALTVEYESLLDLLQQLS